MSWYKTGTVTVTNGSATVTGAGTLFVGAVAAGDAFVGPNGQVYEVTAVISATQITISPVYLGGSQPGATYGIFPTYAALVSFNTRLNALLVNYESVLTGAGAGKFLNGTAAAPGISFVGDTDSGIRWVSANTFALVTGGADRVVVSNTGVEVRVPITGTAVSQSLIEKASTRLIKARDYGLGVSMVLEDDDFNTAVETGNYTAAGVTWVNGPTNISSSTIIALRVDQAQNPNNGVQVAYAPAAGRSFRRYFAGSTFGSWDEIYDTGNILGTVGLVSGVPVGAIIEQGNNANGHFIKLAGGFQKCWGRTTTSGSAAVTQPFPAAFVDALAKPSFTINTSNVLGIVALTPSITSTSMDINTIKTINDTRVATAVEWSIIGRWAA